uniref:lysM and putative peptidoglycan-binding domain-containing protein 1 isoform X1 n=1 Tax=Scatophagus argus TaxID=75038 RepID=UPI001ED83D41|nr:lysM and putative peptidoglycan-binding domain-containing protein 1 isoform X1 [Scatophagus argus]
MKRLTITTVSNFSSVYLRDKMEQIKRANRMYTNDSIFLKKSLSIPVLSDLDCCPGEVDLVFEDSKEGCDSAKNGHTENSFETKQDDGTGVSDLTPGDFLKRLDGLINQSKQAAVKGCLEAEKRVAALEAACTSRTSDCRPLTRSQSVISSPRKQQQQQTPHGAVPLTITKLTKKLRDREDEIFQL